MLNKVVGFVKDHDVAIMKAGGMAMTIGGTILAAIAGDKQQKIDIIKAVEEVNKNAN